MTENNTVHIGEIVRTLERIEAQVLKTNGRVSSLEKWRWGITGGLIVVGGLGAVNVSLLAKLFTGI